MTQIFGILGSKGHGKDTFARMVQEANADFQITHFAKSLKLIAQSIWGLTDDQMSDDKLKEARLDRPIYMDDHVESMRRATGLNVQPMGKVARTPREVLQYFGTEYVRAVQDNYWVQKVLNEVQGKSYYLVPDTRYQNESDALHAIGGLLIKVIRIDVEPSKDLHASETSMLKIKPDLLVGVRTGDLSLPLYVAQCVAANRWEEARLYDYNNVPGMMEAFRRHTTMRITSATDRIFDYYYYRPTLNQ